MSITNSQIPLATQIRDLQREADEAGDSAMSTLCDRALAGDADAQEACMEAIETARAMDDGE